MLGGDGSYSTAPNSPDISNSLGLPKVDLRRDSYDQALKNTDLLWEWHSGPHGDGPQSKIPDKIREQSSPPVPKHVTSVGRHASLEGKAPPLLKNNNVPAVVSSSNTRVQIGFEPPINATSLSSLPGTVITSPPPPSTTNRPNTPKLAHEGGLPKHRSIEELDKDRQNYVPPPDAHLSGYQGSPEDTSAFCLDLSSITGHYSNMVIVNDQKMEKGGQVDVVQKVEEMEDVEKVIDGEPKSSHSSSEESKRRSMSFDMRDVVSSNTCVFNGKQ